MAQEIRIPDIGDFEDVEIIEVLVAEGDTVAAEDPLLTLESDKASMEVPAPGAGVVRDLNVKVGDRVSEGDVIASLESADDTDNEDVATEASTEDEQASDIKAAAEEDEETGDQDESADEASETPQQSKTPTERVPPVRDNDADPGGAPEGGPKDPPVAFDVSLVLPDELPNATPSVRRLARSLGVDLTKVQGSGRAGRILREDVEAHVKQRLQGAPAGNTSGLAAEPPPSVDFAQFGEVEEVELSRIRKISASRLHSAWVHIPHVTHHELADVTALEEFRAALKEEAKEKGHKLTPLAFLVKASVAALREFPDFNASLSPDGERLIHKKYFHIGVAVDTGEGLLVPVLRDCDRKSIYEIADEIVDMAGRARKRRLKTDELKGGCFSISSLGGIGGTSFTPIVNAPEVAIMGVTPNRWQPVWRDGEFVPRLLMPLSLSYDHRVIDGASAARFAKYFSVVLEDVRRLLL